MFSDSLIRHCYSSIPVNRTTDCLRLLNELTTLTLDLLNLLLNFSELSRPT